MKAIIISCVLFTILIILFSEVIAYIMYYEIRKGYFLLYISRAMGLGFVPFFVFLVLFLLFKKILIKKLKLRISEPIVTILYIFICLTTNTLINIFDETRPLSNRDIKIYAIEYVVFFSLLFFFFQTYEFIKRRI